MYRVTKEFVFDSAHWLPDYDGPCSRKHGHTYKLQVTLRAADLYNDMVADFSWLKRIVQEEIVSRYDHQMLNEIGPFDQMRPTAENMVFVFFRALEKRLHTEGRDGVFLDKVVLWETPTSFAEYEERHF